MAFVTGYDHDVFVSYAHADESADVSGKWVSQFVDCLRGALRLRLGGSAELRIFFDSGSLHPNQQLEEILTAVRRSAVFLAIASRSYAARDWTRQELAAFIRVPGDTARLFAVECLPLGHGETYPAPLQHQHRMKLWCPLDPHNSTPIPLSLALDPAVFQQRIHDLAEQIRNQLLTMKKASPPIERIPVRQIEYRPVLLAQVTDELDEERDQVRRYLEQFGVTVLPEGTYPQGGDAFKAAVEADLARAGVFVQLLSRQAGRAPPDLAEGYTRFQHDAAAARGVETIQWRRPDLDLDSVANPQHRGMLSAETVIATGLEAFKAEILRRAPLPPPPPVAQKSSRSSLVFIDADKDDADIAKTLQMEFSRHNFPAVVPTLGGAAEDVRADLEDNIVECDALVVVYGQTTPVWVRGQLRLYNKLKAKRSGPPRILALYSGPPVTKPELGFILPEVREIDGRTAEAIESMRVLIAELES